MKKSMFSVLVLMVGLWLMVFQVPGVSYTASAQLPYMSTGFPQVVVVSGTNYEMGVQYGRQTAPAIFHNVAIFKSKLYEAYGSETVTKDMQVWDYYIRKFDPTLVDWIRGISAGCRNKRFNVSYLDLVLLMVYPTELWARPSDPYPKETHARAQKKGTSLDTSSEGTKYHSCNSFAATGSATPDGKPIHGITTMVSTEGMDNIILIAFPKDGSSFVSQTWPGRINGNAAMNSNGFAWNMTAILIDKPAWGLTEVYFHYLAQLAKSPDEAVNYIQSTPFGGVAGGFLMSDAQGNVSVFEVAPDRNDHYNLRVPGDVGEPGPWVVQTNHLVAPSLQANNPFWLTFIGTYPRYDTVSQFLTEAVPNSVDFSFAKSMFASDDWYDAVAKQWHYNEPGAPGISNDHTSVSQSIFFPADLTAYLQTGTPSGNGLPAYATGEYVKIKLAEDPKKVTDQADADALAFYWDATEFFEYDFYANAPYLTASLAQTVMDKLDEAFSAYSLGMDRAAFAYLETNVNKQLALYGEALTYYAKAQLYSQMVKTMLLRASGKSLHAAIKQIQCSDILQMPFKNIDGSGRDAWINSAAVVPADASGMPEYCAVKGGIYAQDDASHNAQFELRLPTKIWNGKLLHEGGGGFVGFIPTASANDQLKRGYATVGTDTGHVGPGDPSSLYNNIPAELDFGYRAVHLVTVAAKQIVQASYGAAPEYSYWRGCSTGGRQGLIEAQRYPDDFDGIIAGDPPWGFTGVTTIFMGWPDWINRDASGNRILNLDKVPLIQNAVNAACDELDGVKDGIIDDPRRCTWDPLDPSQNYIKICTAGDASDCLTVEQAKIVQKIYDAPRDKSGNIIFPAARPRGAETGWASIIGTGTNPSVNGGLYVLPALQYAVFDPDPGPTYKLFDFPCNFDGCDAAAVAELSKYAPIYNASSTRLDGFKLRNGKMIMYGGWSTAGAQPQALVYYYDKVAQRMGSDVPDYFRLYMIPGMAHCSAASGIGPTNADFAQFFPQLEAWVEKGIAPEEVVTTAKKGAVPTRTRLLCPYPQVAKYKGTAYDSDKAESFTCAYPDYPLQAQEWDGIDLFPWDVPEGIVWH